MYRMGVVSIMTEMFEAMRFGITGRAIQSGQVDIQLYDPRDYSPPPHHSVDDRPYGGGPGMVMCYAPLHQAITVAKKKLGTQTKTIYLSPQGRQVQQQDLCDLVENNIPVLWVAGRYEGIDERIIEHDVDEEWSIGDFVLSGGELAAMVYMDAMVRMVPGCLGHPESSQCDSFSKTILDHPHYTRPAEVDGHVVPDVLLTGDHQAIATWRRQQALGQTWLKRPDLLEKYPLDEKDQTLLTDFKNTYCKAD